MVFSGANDRTCGFTGCATSSLDSGLCGVPLLPLTYEVGLEAGESAPCGVDGARSSPTRLEIRWSSSSRFSVRPRGGLSYFLCVSMLASMVCMFYLGATTDTLSPSTEFLLAQFSLPLEFGELGLLCENLIFALLHWSILFLQILQ